ncbi:hypothetical protein [Chryseobacterium koreense]
MKTLIIHLFTFVVLFSCSRGDNSTKDPVFSLPPETQIGANTFGVTIKGKVYVPRDPTGSSTMPNGKGMIFWGSPDHFSYNEIEVVDGASSVGFKIVLHIENLQKNGVGKYVLQKSNFLNGIDSIKDNHIFFKIWDPNISNYAYYGSIANQGEIQIKRFDGSLTTNWILSGTFGGRFARNDNATDIIEISDGRFDLNLNTLPNHPFP